MAGKGAGRIFVRNAVVNAEETGMEAEVVKAEENEVVVKAAMAEVDSDKSCRGGEWDV